LESSDRKVSHLLVFTIVFVEFIKVILQQFSHQKEMLFIVEVIIEFKDILLITVAIFIDIPQQLDFVDGLVHVILVVLDNLHANHLLTLNIKDLHGLRKSG
jgi:hypothetical protein